jgi:ABC-type transport system involved in multi-copper enzyme maturation permease subunit
VIARLTAVEALRQPICLLVTTTCVAAIVLLPVLITHSLGEVDRLVRDSALAIHLTGGLLLGCYAACSSLVREVRRGTASAILSKPVNRGVFFLAKFAGVALFMALFSAAAGMATLLATSMAESMEALYHLNWRVAGPAFAAIPLAYAYGAHMNYHRNRPFNSATFAGLLVTLAAALAFAAFFPGGHDGPPPLPLRLVPASALVTLAILVLAAISVSLAPRLDTAPTTAVCSVVLMAGLVSDYFLGRPAGEGVFWAQVLYSLVPNWQHFWVSDGLAGDGVISLGYVGHVLLYAAAYMTAVLAAGLCGFRNMDMK